MLTKKKKKEVFVFAVRLCFLKFLNFFSFKLIFLYILDCFDVVILKIKTIILIYF
jgi:hypothetical protein